MNDGGIEIKLTKDEALVLFDWLSRFNQEHDLKFEDQAEPHAEAAHFHAAVRLLRCRQCAGRR